MRSESSSVELPSTRPELLGGRETVLSRGSKAKGDFFCIGRSSSWTDAVSLLGLVEALLISASTIQSCRTGNCGHAFLIHCCIACLLWRIHRLAGCKIACRGESVASERLAILLAVGCRFAKVWYCLGRQVTVAARLQVEA